MFDAIFDKEKEVVFDVKYVATRTEGLSRIRSDQRWMLIQKSW